MYNKETAPPAELVIKPCWRAFFVFYVYIATFLIGPWINPNIIIFGYIHFSVALGTVLGLILIALVVYLKLHWEYRVTAQGIMTIWRWPSKQRVITWENLGNIEVHQGLMQMLLQVGYLLLQDKSGGPTMGWNALSYPKEAKRVIEGRRP